MSFFNQIILPFFEILLHLFAILGVTVGLGLLAVPDLVQQIENFLNRKLLDSSRSGDTLGEDLDKGRNIEHLFFNHHIISGLALVLVPSILIILMGDLPEYAMNPAKEFSTPAWLLFCKVIVFPTAVAFVWWVAVFAIFFGVLVMVAPQYAFRLLRILNRNYPTDKLTLALQEEIPLNQIFYRNAPVFGALFIILSVLLLILLRLN